MLALTASSHANAHGLELDQAHDLRADAGDLPRRGGAPALVSFGDGDRSVREPTLLWQ